MESVTCLSSCSVVLRYLVSGAGAIHGEFPLRQKFSVYATFENFTDRRQTRFDTIYTGSVTNPVFRDIYAPLDGFVANFGVIIKI